ncbi:MAG: putative lipid II flippase FtsW [Candidatus Aminicenantes bacterium]|nr:putative lipid II flippase FtsW [Candidatus Aminicenantes bacterium]
MKSLRAVQRSGFDKTLFFTALVLVVIGVVMVFSASGVLAGERYHQSLYFLIQQAAGAAVGLVLALLVMALRKPLYLSPVIVYGLLVITVFLLALCYTMPAFRSANRWVVVAGLRFQPSELAKISLVLFLAHFCERRRDRLSDPRTLIIPLGVSAALILLILFEPDRSTALIMAGLTGLMLFLGGVRLRHLAVMAVAGTVLLGIQVARAGYSKDRVNEFLSAEKDLRGRSFQPHQAKLAIGSGGLLGVSLGQSTQKLYLPEAHTDFIFAILGEETGLAGGIVTLGLLLLFAWRGLLISLRTPDPAHKMVAAGLTTLIVSQAFINIAVVLGIVPVSGVSLPFLSFGRSSLLCNFLAVGILLNISRRKGDNGVRV